MTRSRGIGRGRAPGSRRTQFGRGGHRPEQPAGTERATERETGRASALPRRNARKRGSGMATGTPRHGPAGSSIAWEDLLARAERAERELDRLRSELADERAGAVRQSREWAAALHALERFPDARRAVLDEVFNPAEEAERAAEASGPAAGASVARPGGEPAVPAGPGVPLPAEKREGPPAGSPAAAVDGRGRPLPPGVTMEPGTPRPRGVGGIGDRYGDSGPLTSAD